MPKLPAIVSSAGAPAAVTITQTLGPLGIPIHALSNMDHAAAWYSRYTTGRHRIELGVGGTRTHHNVHEPESLLHYMLERLERGVVFPGTDSNIRFLAEHKQSLLDAGFRLLIPDARALARAANKSDVAVFCREHGFPVPRTITVDGPSDLERVRDELRFPIVLKGVYVKNHRFVSRVEELDARYEAFLARFSGKTSRTQAVAQEWIPGGDDRFAKLYVICDERSQVIAQHSLRRLRVHTRRDGSQGDTLIAKTERIQPLIDQWRPFFPAVGWVGVASMETKYDERDGLYKLIEINPRPWAILKISIACGMNVPLLYYRLAQGEAVEATTDFEEGRYYIRLFWGNRDFPEPVATLGMLLNRRIAPREVLRVYGELLRNARRVTVDVGTLRDPLPTLACMYYYGVRHFKGWF
jgi:predicted ATP-grasp superfamily ATP-dependent carboligase